MSDKVVFSPFERRASLALSAVYGLRMLGLFLVLPVLALGVADMPGGQEPAAIGLAMGIYGLTQAFFQIPFGLASDRLGRKPVIAFGLLIFAAGSFIAAWADTVSLLILGRALQGAGAVSAAVSAFLADLTREEVRARAMAMVGVSIGLSFVVSLVLAPPLYGAYGLEGLFLLTGGLAVLAALGVLRMRARSPVDTAAGDVNLTRLTPEAIKAWPLLSHSQLWRLNLGIFSLMAVQTAMFVAIPMGFADLGLPLQDHWKAYLPLLLIAFLGIVPPIFWAEKKGRFRPVFLAAVALLALTMLGFLAAEGQGLVVWLVCVALFFAGFNLLEALLPSWVSRVAPVGQRGLALGIYNTSQSLGLFTGGLVGGLMLAAHGRAGIFWACALLLVFWGMMALGLKELGRRRSSTQPSPSIGE
jgi:MFS family permease